VEEISNTGIANTLAGNDRITGVGAGSKYSIFNSGTIDTAEGNDIITGIRNQTEDSPFGLYYAIYNQGGTINTGNGNDIITGFSKAGKGSESRMAAS